MTDLRFGSLFSGYGGLDLGVQSVLGGTTAWFCEFDKAPSKILAHHWPDVPNYGDITQVDFTTVEPVDVLTGGFPCQDVSHAGRRAGLIRDGEGRTRSGLWGHMLRAITELRPSLVVAENVRGLLSARADSDVEPCPWCLGDGDGEPAVRALGAVLADLADVGYDAAWYGLRAADVGAAHGRFRVFIYAWPAADAEGGGTLASQLLGQPRSPEPVRDDEAVALLPTPMTVNRTSDKAQTGRPTSGPNRGGPSYGLEDVVSLLPTPDAYSSTRGGSQHPDKRIAGGHQPTIADVAEHLLPTPRATDGTKGGPNQRGSSGDLMLPSAVQLLPTPAVADTRDGTARRRADNFDEGGHHGVSLHHVAAHADEQRWGMYAPAIARWEAVMGRSAPEPTEPGPKGSPRLSARFVEFLMGLPAGHVTGTGLTRNEQLKALGNGVVPQQAAAATQAFIHDITQERAA